MDWTLKKFKIYITLSLHSRIQGVRETMKSSHLEPSEVNYLEGYRNGLEDAVAVLSQRYEETLPKPSGKAQELFEGKKDV